MRAWEYLRKLSELPPRGSGTSGERRAAEWLQVRLEALGYDVQMQPFMTPRHTLYMGPAIVGAVLIGAVLLAQSWPVVAFGLALISFVPLIGEVLGSGPNFDLILPKGPSQNVFASAERGDDPFRSSAEPSDESGSGTGGPEAVQHIVIVAHYDTQWGSWLFAPWFRGVLQLFFFVTYGAFGLALAAVVLRWAAPAAAVTGVVSTVAIALLIVTGGFLLLSRLTGRAVPGANDNGSGVAVGLALADEWAGRTDGNVRLSFLFTGAEEVGMRGMRHFIDEAKAGRLELGGSRHKAAVALPADTLFINIDNVGGGRLRYMLGEGMVGYQNYDAALVAVAGRVAESFAGEVLPLNNSILPTDALIPAKAGYAAITLLATNADESIPNYHWHTDTVDNAERYTVEQTERFIRRYIEALEELAKGHAS